MDPDLGVLLSALLSGDRPLPISVSLRDDEELKKLRAEIDALTVANNGLQDALNRAEYLFRCESVLNNRLIDLIRAHGISIGSEFFARPY